MEPGQVTVLLDELSGGDRSVLDRLMPVVYEELRRLAHAQLRREREGHTLGTTALVHEAYLKLAGADALAWSGRAHFFGVCAQAMRRVLVRYAEARGAAKRGSGRPHLPLDDVVAAARERPDDLLWVDEALDRLAERSDRCARVVECRVFGGMDVADTAAALEVSPATVKRNWALARAWLNRELAEGRGEGARRITPAGRERVLSDWAEVERLFGAAIAVPAHRRDAYVGERASTPRVAAEVCSVLAAHERSGPLDGFDAPASPGVGEDAPLAAGSRVGAWEVVDELGRGGMGQVYQVRRADGQFEQVAALKILAATSAAAELREPFVAERQLLARLVHPGIARLLDGGIAADGRPYFVMEFVEGVPVTAHARERALSVTQRVELVRRVCEVVQFAHANLVVHRDLKPGNILVTDEGEVRLLDFGIAKVLDDGSERAAPNPRTRVGVRMLTREYAAPEQLAGQPPTTATDVYQLGVLLHELLTGTRPRGADGGPDGGTARPSEEASDLALRRRLRGDLDAIVVAAVRRDPRDRYGSAGELAEDLRRHLEGRPVRAHPDSLGYRARRFARRNRWYVALSGAAALALLGFSAGMAGQARRTAAERDRARRVSDFMVGIFRSADPRVALGDTVTARELLDAGARRVRSELADEPLDRAVFMEAMAGSYEGLGLREPAAELLADALDARRSSRGGDALEELETAVRLASLEVELGRFESAAPRLAAAVEELRGRGGSGTDRARLLQNVAYAWQVAGERERAEGCTARRSPGSPTAPSHRRSSSPH